MDTYFSVASGQTSNHLKWSNLDLFFARPPRGGPEKFLFLYLNHMNRTEPISDELRGPDGLEAQLFWTESSILAQDERWRRA